MPAAETFRCVCGAQLSSGDAMPHARWGSRVRCPNCRRYWRPAQPIRLVATASHLRTDPAPVQ